MRVAADEAPSAAERDVRFDPPAQHYAGATQLPFWSGNDRLREITPSNPRQLWTMFRSSMISRRYASLHLRLQNLLPHQRCVTIPNGPPQRLQLAKHATLPPRTNFPLRGRHRAGRIVEPSRGPEPEVLAQAALFTIAGGAGSPAVAATGRTVGSGRGLSEGRADKQCEQRESSDKRFHYASPCYGRLS